MGDARGTLRSRRLSFTLPEESDAVETAAAITPGIAQWLVSWPSPLTETQALARIRACRKQVAAGGAWHFVLRCRRTRALVGWISAWPGGAKGEWEFGLWIGEPFQRQGVGSEAASFLVEHLVATARPSTITAAVQPENLSSISLLTRLGMSKSHQTTRLVLSSGKARRFLVFSLSTEGTSRT